MKRKTRFPEKIAGLPRLEYMRKWYREHKEQQKGNRMNYVLSGKEAENRVRYRKNLRLAVLTHYSNGTPRCACCGEMKIEFLAIDHINGSGKKHKAEIRVHGSTFYSWLRARNYPLGYRILCHNCNLSLGFYGYCPHQRIAVTR